MNSGFTAPSTLPLGLCALLLAACLGSSAARAESATDATLAELESAVAAATDERGAPTAEQFDLRVKLARRYLASNRADEAIAHLRVAAELSPLDQDLAFLLAEREMQDGRAPAAARQYRLLSERFGSSLAEIKLAELALDRGRDKQALAHARRAVEHADNEDFVAETSESETDLVRALDTLWRTAERVGASGEARSALRRLADLAPDDFRYPWYLGGILVRQGKNAEAVEALSRACKLTVATDEETASRNLEVCRDLGLALVAEDRFEEARDHLDVVLEANPGDPDALAALAQVQERFGEIEAAEMGARRVLDAMPDHAGALLVMGRLYAGSGDFESARRVLESAVASDPDSHKAHYQLSLACARLRDRECAELHLALYQELQDAPEDVVEMTRAEARGDETQADETQPEGGGDGR